LRARRSRGSGRTLSGHPAVDEQEA